MKKETQSNKKSRTVWRGPKHKKTTPEMKRRMILLREGGDTLQSIADRFDVSKSTVNYHVNPKVREDALFRKRATNHLNWKNRLPIQIEKRRKWANEYKKERKIDDSKYNERVLRHNRESYAKVRGLR